MFCYSILQPWHINCNMMWGQIWCVGEVWFMSKKCNKVFNDKIYSHWYSHRCKLDMYAFNHSLTVSFSWDMDETSWRKKFLMYHRYVELKIDTKLIDWPKYVHLVKIQKKSCTISFQSLYRLVMALLPNLSEVGFKKI